MYKINITCVLYEQADGFIRPACCGITIQYSYGKDDISYLSIIILRVALKLSVCN